GRVFLPAGNRPRRDGRRGLHVAPAAGAQGARQLLLRRQGAGGGRMASWLHREGGAARGALRHRPRLLRGGGRQEPRGADHRQGSAEPDRADGPQRALSHRAGLHAGNVRPRRQPEGPRRLRSDQRHGEVLMNLTYTPEQEAFRAEVRAWMEANVPAEPLEHFDASREGFEAHRQWERTLKSGDWGMVTWPKEYGGRG